MARRLSTIGFLCLFITPQLFAAPPRLQIDHQGTITCVAWSANGLRIATASQDGAVRVLDSATGKELHRFASGHAVRGIALAPDGKTLALSQEGHGVSIWNLATGQRQCSNNYTNYSPEHLAFTPDSQTVMGIGVCALFNWKVNGGITIGGGVNPGGGAAVAPDAAVGGWVEAGGLLELFEHVPTGGVRHHTLQVGTARCIAFGPGGKLLAVGVEDREVQLWDLAAAGRKKIGSLTGLHSPPARLSIAADGSALAVAEADETTIRVWDLARRRPRRQIFPHRGRVGSLALSPDGKLLATTGRNGNALLLWDVATRELTRQRPPLELSAREFAGLWADLAEKNYDKSDAAWRKLAAAGDHALPFLREQIRPIAVPPLDRKRVEKLLAELDADRFATREKATQELMRLGETAIVPLERLLEKGSSVEVERRAQTVLKKVSEPVLTPDRLRALDVLELLEQLRSPKALALLQEIERDALIPQLRREARQALQRAAAVREATK
jgi:WD40 repeat protein